MQIVIDIPEEDFERCKKRFRMRLNIMGDAIANGTLLAEVIEDIKAEIKDQMDDDDYFCGLNLALQIIDKHISGKEQE